MAMTAQNVGFVGATPQYAVQVDPAYRSPATDVMAIVAAVLGCFAGWIVVLGPIAAIVVGSIALNRIRKSGADGTWLAVSGIILGACTLVLGIVLTIEFIALALSVAESV